MDIESFVPYIIEDKLRSVYIAVAIECHRCPRCGVVMLPSSLAAAPKFYRYAWDAQVKRLFAKKEGLASPKYGDQILCEDCSKTEVKFTCAHCDQEWGMEQIKTSIGYPAEYLCLTCFKTLTAERWEDIENTLRQSHKHDYE